MTETPLDMADAWRQMLKDWEKQANATLTGVSASPEFNQLISQYMAAGLRMQSAYSEGLEQTMTKLNLPTRGDFRQLNAQLSEVEARLDRLTAAVEALSGAKLAPSDATAPKRTRKPPAKASS